MRGSLLGLALLVLLVPCLVLADGGIFPPGGTGSGTGVTSNDFSISTNQIWNSLRSVSSRLSTEVTNRRDLAVNVGELALYSMASDTLSAHPFLKMRADYFADQSYLDEGNSSDYTYDTAADTYGISAGLNLSSVIAGWWKMNDDAANTDVADSSGVGLTGSAHANTEDINVVGKIDGALTFSGSASGVNIGNGGDGSLFNFGSSPFSVAVWVYQTDNTGYQMVMGKDAAGDRAWCFEIVDGKPGYQNGGRVNDDDVAISENAWVFLTLVADDVASEVRIYVNGSLVHTGTDYPIDPSSADVWIGARAYSGFENPFIGHLDQVQVFNKALTQDEIDFLYNSGTGTDSLTGSGATSCTVQADPSTVSETVSFYRVGVLLPAATDAGTVDDYVEFDLSVDGGVTWSNTPGLTEGTLFFGDSNWKMFTTESGFTVGGLAPTYRFMLKDSTPITVKGVVEWQD